MKKHRLGASDIEVSTIGIGCWAYGGGKYWGEQSQDDVEKVVRAAIDSGVNLFDTAEVYNDGASEEALGKALAGIRDKAVICSKVSPSNAYSSTLRKHCEASLKRLRTDYLDVYMLHWPINYFSVKHFTDDVNVIENPPTIEEAFATLLELQREGKIRGIGISNFGVQQMKEVLATGANVLMNEITYNIVSRAIEKEIVPFCIENNIGIVGSMALQQGLLAGVYQAAKDVPPYQAHSRHYNYEYRKSVSRHGEAGAEEEMFVVLAKLRQISEELGISMAQLAIAWVLSKPGIKSTLVGSRNIQELEANVRAASLELDKATVEEIDRISIPVLEKLGDSPDYYENRKNSRIR